MTKFNFLSFITLIFITLSCSEDSQEPYIEKNEDEYRISSSKYYFADQTFNEERYTWSNKGDLLKKETLSNGSSIGAEDYIYESNRLKSYVISSNGTKNSEYRFEYNGDKISRINYFEFSSTQNESKVYENELEYQGDELKKSIFTNVKTGAGFYSTYSYQEGNLTEIKAYDKATDELVEIDSFFYDNKKNPFYKKLPGREGMATNCSKNNLIRYKITSYRHIPQNPELSFEYEYNANDLPVKQYIIAKNGNKILDETYEYEFVNLTKLDNKIANLNAFLIFPLTL